MPCMSRSAFLKEYELELEQEFEYNGTAAEWAPKHPGPKFWGEEDASITLETDSPKKGNVETSSAAISPDEKVFAVATNAIIRIYHMSTRQQQSELVGHLSNVQKLYFAPMQPQQTSIDDWLSEGREQKYLLFSEGAEVGGGDGQLIAWSLDDQGRQLNRTMPFAVESMADAATDAIRADLVKHHNIEEEDLTAIRDGFLQTLKDADTNNRVKGLSVISDAHFPGFGCYPISSDGTKAFYILHGRTTQSGMRPPDDLPQLVVIDVTTQTEICRLKGHEDAIMWAGWSPDNKVIASACWDQYFKLWDASTGACLHTIGPTGAQNWSGAFSPNGTSVLLSGGGVPTPVAIYNGQTGEEVAKLEQEGLKLDHWMRYFSWNPTGDEIALINGHSVILWKPFEKRPVDQVFRVKHDGSLLTGYNGVSEIKWAKNGELLLLQDSDNTTFVWDREKNVKWRFQRPKGTPLQGRADVFYVEAMDTVVTLDEDGKVRYWNL